jgi:L-seryl-tRNA(Ser) seleniumtransferase
MTSNFMGRPVQRNDVLRSLPSIDELLRTTVGEQYAMSEGPAAAADAARGVIAAMRAAMINDPATVSKDRDVLDHAQVHLSKCLAAEQLAGIGRVINATGVVIHTNIGRAPLSTDAKAALAEASGYCSLEFDLETGKRGSRGGRVDRLLAELTGAEDALIVNNGAAAAFFVLAVFAKGGDVVISRGELVEIGGDFRVPDVLSSSGCTLKEVGTTNRTKLADYARAVGPDTRMVLRVHPSNFRIVGFTAAPLREELSALAREHGLIFYEDLGSGALEDLSGAGLRGEPVAKDVVSAGVDIVSFSGDKLLGGPQSGIIAGRSKLIEQLRHNPLFRVFRADKTTYTALDATLQAYRRGTAFETIPVLRQISVSAEALGERAKDVIERASPLDHVRLAIIDGYSAVGGGAAPASQLPTKLISVAHPLLVPEDIATKFRVDNIPAVIARIESDMVVLDLRTVPVEDEPDLIAAIRGLDT